MKKFSLEEISKIRWAKRSQSVLELFESLNSVKKTKSSSASTIVSYSSLRVDEVKKTDDDTLSIINNNFPEEENTYVKI